MMQWFEEKIKGLFNETNDINEQSFLNENTGLPLEQLKNQIVQLSGKLNKSVLLSTSVGIDTTHLLSQLYTRLLAAEKNPKALNQKYLNQEKQNFKSLLKLQTLEIGTQLIALRKDLVLKKEEGYYLDEINSTLQKIEYLTQGINEIEFSKLCLSFSKLIQFSQKLDQKLETKRIDTIEKLKSVEQVELPEKRVKSLSRDDLLALDREKERCTQLRLKIDDFQKSMVLLIAHLESMPFKSLNIGTEIISVLNNLNTRLKAENIDLENYSEALLEQEKQGFNTFLTLQTLEIKQKLQVFISNLREKRTRGFCISEIDDFISQAEEILRQQEKFPYLCESYTKLHHAHETLTPRILAEIDNEYQRFLDKMTDLQIPLKCQTVQHSIFLSSSEKERFIRLTASKETQLRFINENNIQMGDTDHLIHLTDIKQTYESLLGKKSIGSHRERLCTQFRSSLDKECSLLLDENKRLFTSCIQKILLTGGEDILSRIQNTQNPHPLLLMFKWIRQVNILSDNLSICQKAYEKFVRQNPLSFLHHKSGIYESESITQTAVAELKEILNTELSRLLLELLDNDVLFTEDDFRHFTQRLNITVSQWQKEVLLQASRTSGDHRHSFNNYLKLWLEDTEMRVSRVSVDMINKKINQQKNPFEYFFSFFSRNKQRYCHHDVRTFIRNVQEEQHLVQVREEQEGTIPLIYNVQ